MIKYKKTLSYDTIRILLFSIRKILADAIKLLYIEERIGGPPETNEKVIIDKCNFIHNQNNNQIWVVGGIEPDTRKSRFDIINIRNSTNLKKLLLNHVEAGTLVITDGWRAIIF